MALVEELGIEPSPSLQRLEKAILNQEPALDLPAIPSAAATLTHQPTVGRELPSGTVSLLFTDVEGSTRLLHELGAKGYADALAEHRRVIRDACAAEGGVEVDTQGDAFFCAFGSARAAVACAAEITGALAWRRIRDWRAGFILLAFAGQYVPWFLVDRPTFFFYVLPLTPFMVLYALHDGLAKPMPGNAMAPSLAESWTASKDGLSYTFALRRGVRFHNGQPVTAEDVKFSFERYRGSSAKLFVAAS